MRKLICALLAMMFLIGCGLGACAEEKAVQFRDEVTLPKLTPADHPAIEGESQLTGLPASGEAYTPIAIPLDNSPEVYPLWGISEADVLFQVPLTENGATRLMALYGNVYPEQAGGVRSGRMTLLPLARAFDAAFAYAGVPPIGVEPISVDYWLGEWGYRKPTRHFNLLGDHFRERVDFLKKPNNLSAKIAELHEHLAERKVAFAERPFLFTDEAPEAGEEATVISVEYLHHGNSSKTNESSASTFEWQHGTGYIRTSKAGGMTDRTTGETVAFANVVIMKVAVEWEKGYPYYANQMRGSGAAVFFQDGRMTEGAWLHNGDTDRLVFLDEKGNEMTFQRGKTFIVVGDDLAVQYR